jgi:excisionase family DNA binding protein
MKDFESLSPSVLGRKAIVYVRQSTTAQVQEHLESQRRQYELADLARNHGFRDVEVIDEDQGRSASGTTSRPGFDRLVAQLCAGTVGGVLCLEASRLSRNGRDWHHLLELCALVDARVIDLDGVYNPCDPNDRLLLGMKGTLSEFELGTLRTRMLEALQSKAQRGELRIDVPIGFIWDRASGLDFDPDRRLQEVIALVFAKFRELGSARQVHRWMHAQGIHFARPSDGKQTVAFEWTLVRYRNVISVLKNPFYAGAYAYGKSEKRTQIIDGRAHTSYGHGKAMQDWTVLLKGHHRGYITWDEFERNQKQLASNAYGKRDGAKSARGGQALLTGLLICARCGRRLKVVYTGRVPAPKYRCDQPDLLLAQPRCMAFGARRVDEAIIEPMLSALEPLALEAALQANQMQDKELDERRRIAMLDLEKAHYEATLAERRYAACDPDNRLIAAQLEKSWEHALQRVKACEAKVNSDTVAVPVPAVTLDDLAADLTKVWHTKTTTPRTRQRLVRAMIEDIVADVDESTNEIVFIIHWKGGQHSSLRTPKPKSGEHGRRVSQEAIAVIKQMAGQWNDEHIAATLNRMGLRTGHDKTWNAIRVGSIRTTHKIAAFRSADKNSEWLPMRDAAKALNVTHHKIRRLIRDGDLPAIQVVPGAPYQILNADLKSERVTNALNRKQGPRQRGSDLQLPLLSTT